MKKMTGFTLIELILVLGLLTTLGALAAPQFADVFDQSKDQADIAQMDMLMAAFQLEQAPYYEAHDGAYDLLQASNMRTITNGKGEIVGTELIPEKAVDTLQNFLDATADPNSSVYMEDAVCISSGQSHGKNGSIFQAELVKGQSLKIVCQADGNESTIRLSLPGFDRIAYDYSEGEMEKGTWLVIGEDDRLRADYVADLMRMTKQEAAEEFLFDNKGKQTYRYRTEFMLSSQERTNTSPSHTLRPTDRWITWDPNDSNSATKIVVRRGDLTDFGQGYEDIEIRYKLNSESEFHDLGQGKEIHLTNNSSNKKALDRITFRFYKPGGSPQYLYYALSVIKDKNWSDFVEDHDLEDVLQAEYGEDYEDYMDILSEDNDRLPGLIWMKNKEEKNGKVKVKGKPHIFYYAYTQPNPQDHDQADAEIEGEANAPFDFYGGTVFNYLDTNNYDAIVISGDASKKDPDQYLLTHYRVVDGEVRPGSEKEKKLDHFSLNQWYEMDLEVNSRKAILQIDGGQIRNKKFEFTLDSTLTPAVGFYLHQHKTLQGNDATASDLALFPLVRYQDREKTGPELLLKSPPVFQMAAGSTEPNDKDYKMSVSWSLNANKKAATVQVSISHTPEATIKWTLQGEKNSMEFPLHARFDVEENGTLKIEAKLDQGKTLEWEGEISGIMREIDSDAFEFAYEYNNHGKQLDAIRMISDYDTEYGWVPGLEVDWGSIDYENLGLNYGKSYKPKGSGWLLARINDRAGVSGWKKTPWVDLAGVALEASESINNSSKQLVHMEPLQLPSIFNPVFFVGTKETVGESVEIDNRPGMSVVEVKAYVEWMGLQVSEMVEAEFEYQNYKPLQAGLEITQVKKGKHTIQVRTNQECTIKYRIDSGKANTKKVKAKDVERFMDLKKNTKGNTLYIEIKTDGSTLTGTFSIFDRTITEHDTGWISQN